MTCSSIIVVVVLFLTDLLRLSASALPEKKVQALPILKFLVLGKYEAYSVAVRRWFVRDS